MARRGARVRDGRRDRHRRGLALAVGLTLTAAVLAGAVVGVQMLFDPVRFPIRNVRVEGRFLFLQQAALEPLVAGELGGGFFGLDVGRLKQAVEAHPWVASVSVRRVWPDTVVLGVRERQPVARWGERALIDARAVVFEPPSLDGLPGLARLDGPAGSERAVLDRYRELARLLKRYGAQVASVRLSPRGAWRVRLDGGAEVLLGRRGVDERVRRLATALAAGLAEDLKALRRIDLRYGNGMALRYRGDRPGRWPARESRV